MLQRQSHAKSKNGCDNCKRRHIKCDEQVPNCLNCTIRKMPCRYKRCRRAMATNVRDSLGHMSTMPLQVSSQPVQAQPEHHKLLGIELMHQWTAHTWKGFCTIPEEQAIMQDGLPRAAMENTFLLYGIFASAALNLAISCGKDSPKSGVYSRAALQYYNMGSAEFRRELCTIRPDIIHLLYLHAAIGASACLLLPECLPGDKDVSTALDRMVVFFDMAIGATSFLGTHQAKFEKALTSVTIVRDFTNSPIVNLLALDDRGALDRIAGIVEEKSEAHSAKQQLYRRAVERLRLCFAAQVGGTVKSLCLSFPKHCGPQFTTAVKERDPVAMLLLMHLAVLLHRLKEDYWWLGSIGQELIFEMSVKLRNTAIAETPAVLDAVAWTMEQVEKETIDALAM